MTQTALYPGYLGRDSLESYLASSARRRRPVYLAVLALVAALLATLPLVRVDLSVQAAGLVRPVVEKSEVRVPVGGRVTALRVRQGQRVERGAPLAEIETGALDDEAGAAGFRLRELEAGAEDLRRLTTGGRPVTPRYRREAAQLAGELDEIEQRRVRVRAELARAETLAARGLGPAADAETRRAELAELDASARLAAERYRARWQAELAQLAVERRDAGSQVARLRQERSLHAVAAPVTGTVEELASVAPGSFLQAGQSLAVISPSSTVVAELYVSPRDVGLLRVGMPVRLQVDAFRYTDWGFLPGRVVEIADDFALVDRAPVFRVRCALDRDRLTLPNGAVGRVKKGMTLRAHFLVGRRSLFQLLRGDAADLLDPRAGHPGEGG